MWFGTQDGLNKFDGFNFKVFRKDPTNESSLPSSDIYSLKQLSNDLIIVGTLAGPGFFNPVTETCARLQSRNSEDLNMPVLAIEKLNDSVAALGTGNGIYLVNYITRRFVKHVPGTENVEVKTIKNIGGTVYAGTMGKGIIRLSGEGVVAEPIFVNDIQTRSVTALATCGNTVFAGTFQNGIIQLERTSESLVLKKQISFRNYDPNTDIIRDICCHENKLFVSSGYGFAVYNIQNGESNCYYKKEGAFELNSNACNNLLLDKEGNCWIGTELGGVNVAFANASRFPVSMQGNETSYPDIFCFNENGKDNILVGGVKNLRDINIKTGSVTDHSSFLGAGSALCITKESENIVWVGTWGLGLFRYDLQTKKATHVLKSELGGTVLCLRIINGFLYAGTVGDGLFKINLKTLDVTHFTEKEGLGAASIGYLYIDVQNNLWLGTLDKGLLKMKGVDKDGKLSIEKRYINSGKAGQIAANDVRAINSDQKGNLWVATAAGLSKLLTNNSFKNYYERDGLPSSALYSLLSDSAGNFWMSSNSGIIRFNPNLPENEIRFKNYRAKDGLVNTEYSTNAYYFSSNGYMCFGGTMGYNVFRPSQIKDNPNAPQVYIVGYKRGGKDVPTDSLINYKTHLKLSWRENYFQFELTALDYSDPAAARYIYMLDGYDKDWSEPTNVRYVSYTELPGGEYTFKVKACNSDGVWNETPYEIKITVVPPFWKTKTFYVFSILLVIGGFLGYTQYRTRAIKKENKILEAKVAERTKELHEKNLDIMASINYAKRIQEAMLPARDQIFMKFEKVFILYRPKDIVSGDFYWFGEKNGVRIFAAIDCTGHGVPGAFMSMIGHNQLNQIVMEKGITEPGEILNHLHRGIQAALRQGHNEISTNDGMDCSLLALDEKGEAQWAGANRPLVMVAPNSEFSRLEGDKFPVGGAQAHVDRVFTTHQVNAVKGTMAYMFSDGYADQFGGEKGKKFMVKKLHETLIAIHLSAPEQQRDELERRFLEWMHQHEQVDDVLVVGIGL